MEPLRLNLASGTDLKSGNGWVNLDVVGRWPGTERGCDVIWDATKDPLLYAADSVDECYCGYLFLHVPPRHHVRLINDIFRVMKPGCPLTVGEVDMRIVMPRWLENPQDQSLSQLIWGEQGSEHGEALEAYDRHVWGWTEDKLSVFLVAAGFDKPRRISIHSAAVFYEMTLETRK